MLFEQLLTELIPSHCAAQGRAVQLRSARPCQLPRERTPDDALHPHRRSEVPDRRDGRWRSVADLEDPVPVRIRVLGQASGEGEDDWGDVLALPGSAVGDERLWCRAGFAEVEGPGLLKSK